MCVRARVCNSLLWASALPVISSCFCIPWGLDWQLHIAAYLPSFPWVSELPWVGAQLWTASLEAQVQPHALTIVHSLCSFSAPGQVSPPS
jgi:hypothetical protein